MLSQKWEIPSLVFNVWGLLENFNLSICSSLNHHRDLLGNSCWNLLTLASSSEPEERMRVEYRDRLPFWYVWALRFSDTPVYWSSAFQHTSLATCTHHAKWPRNEPSGSLRVLNHCSSTLTDQSALVRLLLVFPCGTDDNNAALALQPVTQYLFMSSLNLLDERKPLFHLACARSCVHWSLISLRPHGLSSWRDDVPRRSVSRSKSIYLKNNLIRR